jgi:hypothetical protein
MDAGTTFLRADADKHLWVVLSDPALDPEKVLIVNLTTLDERKERACILNRGDHPWITHETCANYADSVVTTLAKLNAARDGGAIRLQAPLSPEVLHKIRNGVLDSERISLDNAEILFEQGLIEG